MHGRSRVGLGDDEQPLLQHPARRPPGSSRRACAGRSGPGAGCRDRCPAPPRARVPRSVAGHQAVLPVAEEGEVVVGEPAQQRDRVGDVLVRHRQDGRRRARRPGAGPGCACAASPRPPPARRSARAGACCAARASTPSSRSRPTSMRIQLSTSSPGLGVVRLDIGPDLEQPAERLPPHHDLRVDEQVEFEPGAVMAAVTESTRNGMSSVTIRTTVRSPGSARCAASSRRAAAASASSRWSRVAAEHLGRRYGRPGPRPAPAASSG